ncbi:sodium-dependent dopamine transporter-like [Centruroides sculpturatus]|uniref:sodium-dependent dopamine transporter-like n=1 Tax=Centruroides sculpturatus TaxID=218467 RepID=UPI000C6DBA34|nr:sodium-dependent dopamine transporter-like [Centruroides sculpturatus]
MSSQNIEEQTEMTSPCDDFDRGKHKRHVTIRDEGYFSSSSTPKPARQGTSDSTEIELEKETGFSEVSNKIQLPDTNNVNSTTNRPTWNKKADFLLSIIGFAVDLANVWRFPYLCYRNGGGENLFPYFILLISTYLTNRYPLCVGYCAVLISWYVSFYYNVIICWALFFMVSSISPQLPWIHCQNIWNTETCLESADVNGTLPGNRTSPVVEFFEREVLELHLSEGIDDLGYPKWQLVLCLLAVFIIIYFALFKGVHSSGKVVWVTATAPYIILTILLFRGILLPGAKEGVIYYISPDISKLSDSQNEDCIITTAVNSFTSLYSGFVIFVYLGYMANKHGVPINKVAADGHGLVFQVYPEALATLPGGSFWAVIFFFMLLTLGLDSAMGGLESVITGLMDEFRDYLQWRFSRQIFTAFIISISFFIGIINVTRVR